LDSTFSLLILDAKIEDLKKIPVFRTDLDLPTQYYKDIFSEEEEAFFVNTEVQSIMSFLSNRTDAVNRDELILYLRAITGVALSNIINVYKKHNLIDHNSFNFNFCSKKFTFNDAIARIKTPVGFSFLNDISKSANDYLIEYEILNYSNDLSDDKKKIQFLFMDDVIN
jgi:hypothetical protein